MKSKIATIHNKIMDKSYIVNETQGIRLLKRYAEKYFNIIYPTYRWEHKTYELTEFEKKRRWMKED